VGVAVDQDPNERTVVERRDPLVGHVFDRRFRVEARIAAGGFGAIYRATHVKSGHEFALKILHANLTSDPRVVARFRREGAALIRLRDPHTITAYELGEAENGTLYIVMELLHGESLYARYRARGPMPWPRVIAMARAVCSSLVEAHALGVIHRDLKPTNIHLEERAGVDDFVKVLDFGIAKILQDSDIDSSDLTHAGQMVGTLDYMSPEQMIGGTCTATTDIYTLGVVMYEMIAGKKPFDDANNATAALATMLTATPDRLSACAMVTPQVDHLVMRCLERAQGERYQTALELAAALDELMVADEAATAVNTTTLTGTGAPRQATPPPKLLTPAPSLFATTLPLPVRRDLVPAVSKPARRDPTPETARRAAAVTEPSPVPQVADLDSTIVGHAPATRLGATPARGTPHIGMRIPTPPTGVPHVALPHAGTPLVPSKNLREAYPMINRPVPSAMRSPFDDRPPSSVSVLPFDAAAARRDVLIRRAITALACVIAVLAAILLLTRR
jgi:eukaryotic-like serine/threonine-protein kinase